MQIQRLSAQNKGSCSKGIQTWKLWEQSCQPHRELNSTDASKWNSFLHSAFSSSTLLSWSFFPGGRWQLLRQDTGTIWVAHDATELLVLQPPSRPKPRTALAAQAVTGTLKRQGRGWVPKPLSDPSVQSHCTTSHPPLPHNIAPQCLIKLSSLYHINQRNSFMWSKRTP